MSRRRIMGDDERAMIGQRTPPRGVPATGEPFDHDPTPPPRSLDELERRLWPLRHAGDQLTELATNLGRLEARVSAIEVAAGSVVSVGEAREELMEHIVDIKGQSGNNGKIGKLTDQINALEAKVGKEADATTSHNRWLVGLAIPFILAIAGGALLMRDETKSARKDIDSLRQSQQRLEAKMDNLIEAVIGRGKRDQ